MTEEFEQTQGKSAGDLGREALWFFLYSLIAVGLLAIVVLVIALSHVSSEETGPKLICTVLALLVPMVGGFIIARVQRNQVAKYIWIAGLLFFFIVCVWVVDLPTGVGLCEGCGALAKLYRTFFAINDGSGLMGGDGLLVGTWVPLSMIGFAIGAKFGLNE